ncbi:hypothetical protein B0H17DRAFT_1149616 [Mycena rosella]|uniref:Uncharacterized protein n=1 Tax=Mycena rosella TaxID=1033263 RepID=A0AAD7C0T1_MYCRO|nr:hypothetical protein B0H17DRAFT_1149616 [Mycena rosella]
MKKGLVNLLMSPATSLAIDPSCLRTWNSVVAFYTSNKLLNVRLPVHAGLLPQTTEFQWRKKTNFVGWVMGMWWSSFPFRIHNLVLEPINLYPRRFMRGLELRIAKVAQYPVTDNTQNAGLR